MVVGNEQLSERQEVTLHVYSQVQAISPPWNDKFVLTKVLTSKQENKSFDPILIEDCRWLKLKWT